MVTAKNAAHAADGTSAAWLADNPVRTIDTQQKLLRFVQERHEDAARYGDVATALAIQAFETRDLVDRLTLLLHREGVSEDGVTAIRLLTQGGDLAAAYGERLEDMPARVFDGLWRSCTSYAADARDAAEPHAEVLSLLADIADLYGWPDDSLMTSRFARAWANVADQSAGTSTSAQVITLLQRLPGGLREDAKRSRQQH